MKTRRTALAAAVSSLSMLTACGGGGGGSGDVPQFTPEHIPVWSTAEGAWTGTVGTGGSTRALSGVVTHDKVYWLAYNGVNTSIPAGFYTDTAGFARGSFSSSRLREFNFEGTVPVGRGTTTATYLDNVDVSLGDKSTLFLNGNFLAGDPLKIEMHENTYFGGANGPLIMDLVGTYDPEAAGISGNGYIGLADVSGHVAVPGFATEMDYSHIYFDMDSATGWGWLNQPNSAASNCTGNTGTACPGFSQALVGDILNDIKNFQITTTKSGESWNANATQFTAGPGTFTWTAVMTVPEGGKQKVYQLPFSVTLTGDVASIPKITPTPFATTYDANYDAKPSLPTVAGSYTASPAYTGIGNAMHTDTTTFSISSSGAISGAEAVTGCSYNGKIDVYKVGTTAYGNAYAVTDLNFTGVSCPYLSSGAFTGIATYNAGKLTLTATNSARDKGFMLVVIKP